MLQLLLLAVLLVGIDTSDMKERIAVPPPPMPGFNLMKYMGPWFLTYRKASCSWPGSSSFSDYVLNIGTNGGKFLSNTLTWRKNGVCNSVTMYLLFKQPGLFTIVDNMGDVVSGNMAVVATDYSNFVIHWGCTKMSAIGKKCDDPWVGVGTRLPVPPPDVVAMIEQTLQSYFSISMGELTVVPHKMPCRPQGCRKF